jgi:hypothetical protein
MRTYNLDSFDPRVRSTFDPIGDSDEINTIDLCVRIGRYSNNLNFVCFPYKPCIMYCICKYFNVDQALAWFVYVRSVAGSEYRHSTVQKKIAVRKQFASSEMKKCCELRQGTLSHVRRRLQPCSIDDSQRRPSKTRFSSQCSRGDKTKTHIVPLYGTS